MISSRKLVGGSGLPPHEAVRLLSLATGSGPGEVRAGIEVAESAVARFAELVERRLGGEPLQYLEGEVPFGPVVVAVDRRVLIPRPETEYLYELAVSMTASPKVVVDLCTGSGALALALKRTYPAARVYGCDLSAEALKVAESNGRLLDLGVDWLQGDLWGPVPEELAGLVDLMVANPPYVSESEWERLPTDVQQEPRLALVAGPIGTEVIERLLDETMVWLAPGGVALVEVGETQASALAARWPVDVLLDQFRRPRFLRMSRPITS